MASVLTDILNKKVQVEEHFGSFTKSYRKELAFIELRVQQDVERLAGLAICCLSFCGNLTSGSMRVVLEEKKLNSWFYMIFQNLSMKDRQDYYLSLLQMIGSLVLAWAELRDEPNDCDNAQNYLKAVRDQLKEELQHIDPSLNSRHALICEFAFSIRTVIDGRAADKIVRVDCYSMLIYRRLEKKEVTQKMDIRNYLLQANSNFSEFAFTLEAVFESVTPRNIRLMFSNTEERNRLVPYLQEMVKIGRIDRLVDSFDLEMIVYGGNVPKNPRQKKDAFSTNLMKEADGTSQQVTDNDNIKESQSSRLPRKKLKRYQSQLNYYSDLKTKLIEVLGKLTEKKLEENQKVNHFLHRPLTVRKTRKSESLIQASQDEEARIVRCRKIVNSGSGTDSQLPSEAIDEAILQIVCLIREPSQNEQAQNNERKQSFRSSDDEEERNLDKRIYKKSSMKQSQNIYAAMYPGHKLNLLDTLLQFQQIEIDSKIWAEPPSKAKKSMALSEADRAKLLDKVGVYQHKRKDNQFKVVINLSIEFKYLVLALANLEAWPKWHPNIGKMDIGRSILQENAYEVDIECEAHEVKFESYLKLHLFRVDNKYFLAMKSTKSPSSKGKIASFFSFLGFSRSSSRNYEYLLFTLQNYGSKEGNNQIVIDVELSPFELKGNGQLKKEQLSFLINFWFISTFRQAQHQGGEEGSKGQEYETMVRNCMFKTSCAVASCNFVDTPPVH